jgi:hypothetical protein
MFLNFQFNDPWQEYDLNHFKWRKVGPIPLALPIPPFGREGVVIPVAASSHQLHLKLIEKKQK